MTDLWGATQTEWEQVCTDNVLRDHIVPICANQTLDVAPTSKLKSKGKVPSVKNANGCIVGLAGWSSRHAPTEQELKQWSGDCDLGFGIRCGSDGVYAIDCDINDSKLSAKVLQILRDVLCVQDVSLRTRGGTRWATLVHIIDESEALHRSKQIVAFNVEGSNDTHQVEILGYGQQLACAGTHPSGTRYQWSDKVRAIDVTASAFDDFVKRLTQIGGTLKTSRAELRDKSRGTRLNIADRLYNFLTDNNLILATDAEGKCAVQCPWCDQHTTDSGLWQTVYIPAGVNAVEQAGFKCLHAHCADRTTTDYVDYCKTLGYTETLATDYPDVSEIVAAQPTPAALPTEPQKALTLPQIRDVLISDNALSGIAYNELSGRIEVLSSLPWHHSGTDWRDVDDDHLYLYLQEQGLKCSAINVERAVAIVSDDRSFHPIKQYFDALPAWDGIPRVDTLLVDVLGAENTQYTREVTRISLKACIKRILAPGCKYDTMTVLEGPQGIGKSSLLRALGRDDWFSDSLSFGNMNDKSGAELIRAKWIVEVGEMCKGRGSDVESIKSFLSRQNDEYREAYGRRTVSHPRQCVLFGTTNATNGYLTDVSGNRRFLPVKCGVTSAKLSPFKLPEGYIDQVWAEALALLRADSSCLLSADTQQQALIAQQQALETDEREGLIADYLERLITPDWDKLDITERLAVITSDTHSDKCPRKTVSAIEIWTECLHKDKADLNNYESRRISAILFKLGWRSEGARGRSRLYGMQRLFTR